MSRGASIMHVHLGTGETELCLEDVTYQEKLLTAVAERARARGRRWVHLISVRGALLARREVTAGAS